MKIGSGKKASFSWEQAEKIAGRIRRMDKLGAGFPVTWVNYSTV